MRILGIDAFHGDASAALIEDGVLLAACYLKTHMDLLALGNWVLTRPTPSS